MIPAWVGKQLGKAFDIPPFLHGESFYAAVVLKVGVVSIVCVHMK